MIGAEVNDAIRALESQGFKFVTSELKTGKPSVMTFVPARFKEIFYSYSFYQRPETLVKVFDEVQKFDWYEVKAIYAAYECFLIKEVPRHQ